MAILYRTGFVPRQISPAQLAQVDSGSGPGVMAIGMAGLSDGTNLLALVTLQKPSFSYAAFQATLLGVPLVGNVTASGRAVIAELRNSSGTVIIPNLSVGIAGADIDLDAIDLLSGQIVTITDGTLTLSS